MKNLPTIDRPIYDLYSVLDRLPFGYVTRKEINDFVDFLLDTPFRDSIISKVRSLVLSRPSSRDLFVRSLSELADTGDIDTLVRHLNWQHNDIMHLTHELQGYERALVSLDKLRQKNARLHDEINKLRSRNSELVKYAVSLKSLR